MLLVAALGNLPDKPAAELLRQFGDWSPFVRTQAAKALASQGAGCVPQLLTALQDKNPAVRRAATDALAELCKPPGSGRKHPSPTDRGIISAVTPLAKTLTDPDAWVRCGAAEALAEFGTAGNAAAPALFKALGDPEPWVVERAATALENVGVDGLDKRQLLPVLISLLKNPRSRIRMAAVKMLGQLGDDARVATPQLLESVRQRCPDSMFGDGPRAEAAQLLAKWKAPEAVTACLALITEQRWGRQYRCSRAIGILASIGPAAKEAVPALEQVAADDKHADLQKPARKALAAIKGETKSR